MKYEEMSWPVVLSGVMTRSLAGDIMIEIDSKFNSGTVVNHG